MTRIDLDVEHLLADANSPAQIRATRAETIALCKRVLALEAALRDMLSERGCSGCIPADRAPDYVRGKNTRLAIDEHEGDCMSLRALRLLEGGE